MKTLTGKGYYIWIVSRCEKGDPERIAALARESQLTHVIIKIADGAFPYNINLNNGFDYVRPVIKKLQSQGISVWGWHYVYGDHPQQEAEIAVKRSLELGVDGYVVNAEKEYKLPNRAIAASRFMNILRSNLGSLPIALSSYRYPSYHRSLPWTNFLDRCDYNMPQVYWMGSHGQAGAQLKRCINEFKNIHPFRPIIPTGPTFKEWGWVPREEDVIEFMQVAQELNIPAVNFWSWDNARRDLPSFWDLVRDYNYELTPQVASLPKRYIQALNNRNPLEVVDFYRENAVHIRSQNAIQGKTAIKAWVTTLLDEFPDGDFSLISETQNKNIHSFQWQATDKSGMVFTGRETLGTHEDQISYQYSFFSPIETAI